MMHLFSPAFSLFNHKITFSLDPRLFFPISVNTALRTTLTYPSTLGGAYPKLCCARTPNFEMSCGEKKRGSGENAPFVEKNSEKVLGKIRYIPGTWANPG